ncbi:DUF397 domain-containing protein [Streptomyces brasiliscabiei]|uniref:DUF397 domain-containing protein n=1 Tax=Streptomyces brasiliscabiei TaxID=2736302 RepID=UPI001C11644D|nr:DUF397 domain-containing protein [Streptomyces brasiliscabiei]
MAESSDYGHLLWFKSSYSNGAGGECVECAISSECTLVRDSKVAGGAVILVRSGAWRSFTQGLATWKTPGSLT